MTTNHDIENVQICVSHVWKLRKNHGNSEQWASVSCIHIQLIKKVSYLGINQKSTLTFIVLSPWIKSLLHPLTQKMMWKGFIYKLYRSHDVMSEARNKINKGFEDLSEYQDALASKNGVIDMDISNILDINMGWGYNVRN